METPKPYLEESRRPLSSLVFIVPPLIIYELGVLLVPEYRNGVDGWLRIALDILGFARYLLPLLTVGLLLAWHHTTAQRWRVSAYVIFWMYAECALLGFVLLMVSRAVEWVMGSAFQVAQLANITGGFNRQTLGNLVAFLGAGIYEELFFRLLMIPALGALVGMAGGSPKCKLVVAVGVSSLLFSAAHFLPGGKSFAPATLEFWTTFVFLLVAGGYFAMLFLYRGFGIAAGTHAAYNIFVGMIWNQFF